MRLRYEGGVSMLWLLCFFLLISREAQQTAGCGGCGSGGSGSGENGLFGGGSMMGILIGFLLARTMSTGTGTALNLGTNRAVDPAIAPNLPTGSPHKISLSPETVARIDAMRKEKGFGFLWGKDARVLKRMADLVERSGGQVAPKLVSWQRGSSSKVKRLTTKKWTTKMTTRNAPNQHPSHNSTLPFDPAEMATAVPVTVQANATN